MGTSSQTKSVGLAPEATGRSYGQGYEVTVTVNRTHASTKVPLVTSARIGTVCPSSRVENLTFCFPVVTCTGGAPSLSPMQLPQLARAPAVLDGCGRPGLGGGTGKEYRESNGGSGGSEVASLRVRSTSA